MGSIDNVPELAYTSIKEIPSIVREIDQAFKAGKTTSIPWRKEQLKSLWHMLDDHEEEFRDAVFQDSGKLKLEAQLFEIIIVKNDILHMLQELDSWLAPEIHSAPSPYEYWQPTIHKQPKGTVLIISPWNYPICLTLLPLVAVIATGNTGIIKPSELSPAVAQKMTELLPKYIDSSCYTIVNGAAEVVTALLEHPYGHVIYTGSGSIGKIVMGAAAKHLTPVTLELGGKSPVIVSDKANIALAAKRTAWGKFWNAGQTCMCPDYVLVEKSVLSEFVAELKKNLGPYTAGDGSNLSRIINERHWGRVTSLISSTKGTVFGGKSDKSRLLVEPTLVTDLKLSDPLMASEIFGPILPIISYTSLSEVPGIVASVDATPLGLYVFTEDAAEGEFIRDHTSSGGMTINDVMGHVAVTSMPFGGFGASGFGSYRGRASIDTFSHRKSVATVPTSADFEGLLEWRYPDGDREAKFQIMKTNLEGNLVD